MGGCRAGLGTSNVDLTLRWGGTGMMALVFVDNVLENNCTVPAQNRYTASLSQTVSVYGGKIPGLRLLSFGTWSKPPMGFVYPGPKSLQCLKYLHDWLRLGRTCGFEKKLESMVYGEPQGGNLLVRIPPI